MVHQTKAGFGQVEQKRVNSYKVKVNQSIRNKEVIFSSSSSGMVWSKAQGQKT